MKSCICFSFKLLLACSLTLAGCVVQPTPKLQGEANPPPAAPTAIAPHTQSAPTPTPPESPPAPTPAKIKVQIQADKLDRLGIVNQIEVPSPGRIIWSNDGELISSVSPDGLKIFNAVSLATLTAVEVKTPFYLLDYSPQTNLIAVATSQTTLDLREANSGKTRHTLNMAAEFTNASFSPDGNLLAVPFLDQIAVSLWDTQTGEQKTTLSGFETAAPVYTGQFSGSNDLLLWISRASVQLMDIKSGKLYPRLEHEDFVGATRINPDERIVATSAAGTVNNDYLPIVKLWNIANGTELGTLALDSQDGIPASLAFSPDGRLLAIPQGNQISLWDIAAQQKLVILQGPTDRVTSVAFSPDGTTLAAGAADHSIRFWQVTP